jgi:type I restriction enzyme S subunit
VNVLGWANDLPENWEAKPLRTVARYVVSNVDKLTHEHEIPVRLCNYADVYHNEFITLDLDFMRATVSQDEIEKFGLRVDDVLITKDSESWDDIGIPGLVRQTSDDLVCGYHLALVRTLSDKVTGSFLFRCLQAKPVRVQLELVANGITRFGITKSEIGSLRLPVPPLPQQRIVADFLDRETARLDELVTAKERVLTLLEEKRVALITSAVTRGLDPDAPLRDSGIPWLGEIPAHWATERARWLFSERDERSDTGDEELLSVSHLTGVTPRSEKDVNMFEAATTEGYKLCAAGDLVVNTLWAWMGAMGVAPVDGIVSPAYNVYIPGDRLDSAYVDFLVRLPVFAQEVTRHSKGVWSSRLRLYPEGLFAVTLPVPPLDEQRAIVACVASSSKQLDELRNATERSIALLKERRASIIAAAVTGRVGGERAP